jgi:hypothetical protein
MMIIWLGVAANLKRQGLAYREAVGLALLGFPLDGVIIAALLA